MKKPKPGKMQKLENWSITIHTDNPYMAPELGTRVVVGKAVGGDFDGQVVMVPLGNAEGRVVTTESGEQWLLGTPHPDYMAWLTEVGLPPPDPDNPIQMVDQLKHPGLHSSPERSDKMIADLQEKADGTS